jgi:hypothetical protein
MVSTPEELVSSRLLLLLPLVTSSLVGVKEMAPVSSSTLMRTLSSPLEGKKSEHGKEEAQTFYCKF